MVSPPASRSLPLSQDCEIGHRLDPDTRIDEELLDRGAGGGSEQCKRPSLRGHKQQLDVVAPPGPEVRRRQQGKLVQR